MKTKIVFQLTFIATLAVMMTGCCTPSLLEITREETTDRFFPSAVYQSTNGGSFALEGGLDRHIWTTTMVGGPQYLEPPVHSYLIISQNLTIQPFQTNGSLLLEEIQNLSTNAVKTAKTKNKLPPNFEKIADLPRNDVSLALKKHHPNEGLIVLLPVAVAVDIAFSPIYVLDYAFLAMQGAHE